MDTRIIREGSCVDTDRTASTLADCRVYLYLEVNSGDYKYKIERKNGPISGTDQISGLLLYTSGSLSLALYSITKGPLPSLVCRRSVKQV
jgi:hypothetical protein